MRFSSWLKVALGIVVASVLISCMQSRKKPIEPGSIASRQVPTWSTDDMDFFLHGSMGSELVPEAVLKSWIHVYPDLFSTQDLSHLGLIPDPVFGWPIGISRAKQTHLGGLSSVGVNCASCHVSEFQTSRDGPGIRVLGNTSHFDPEAFFGAVIAASFRTEQPRNMRAFLAEYAAQSDPANAEAARALLDMQWQKQEPAIYTTLADDPSGAKGAGAGGLQTFAPGDLELNRDRLSKGAELATVARSMLKLFHNMRTAVHFPDTPPEKSPPASGPGRNDAFGILSLELFGVPKPYAPSKFGLVWNIEHRKWVHWDGDTQSPTVRNLLAALGLGAPMIGRRGLLDFSLVQRQTAISERIHPPKYPLAIDSSASRRGEAHYLAKCALCHNGPEGDQRLYAVAEIGTDPLRAMNFDQAQADRFNQFANELEIPGYIASAEPGVRSTQKYWASTLAGVWARSPYLHNGSVRTMRELLKHPADRPASFRRGSRVYDVNEMGYIDEGPYQFNTREPGNSNAGHDFGGELSDEQRHDLIEYLKTL